MPKSVTNAPRQHFLPRSVGRLVAVLLSFVLVFTTLSYAPSPAHADDTSGVGDGECPATTPQSGDDPDGSKNPDALDTLGDAWLSIASHFDPNEKKINSDDLASQLGEIVGALIVDEDTKGAQVEAYRDNLKDCFPGYHVMVTQSKGITQADTQGLLFSHTKSIAKTTYRAYVFKAGTFKKTGDLGPKNWAYSGGIKSDDGHTVTFNEAADASRNDNWYKDSFGDDKDMKCEVAGVRAPNADMLFAAPDGEYGETVKDLLQRAKHCWPSYNLLITREGGDADFDGLDSLKMADGSSPYRKKLNISNAKFWLYVVDQGEVTSTGDGGWQNWAYSTTAGSSKTKSGMKVEFSQREPVNLNPDTTFNNGNNSFADPQKNECDEKLVEDDGSIPQQVAAALKKCHPGKGILVAKSLDKFAFSGVSGLKHVYLADGYDGFTIDSGLVLNTGDGGYKNWAAYGADEGYPKDTANGDHYMVFSPDENDDDDSSGDDENDTDPVPDFGSHPSTFKVDTGSGSFDATQPENSVGTYVIKDGKAQNVTLTSADGDRLKYKMNKYGVTSQGSSSTTITVDSSKEYQRIDGFGGAMTSSAAQVIGDSAKKDSMISDLFGTGDGQAGLTMVRSPIGASDMQASDDDSVYTLEDSQGSFNATPTDGASRQVKMLQAAKSKTGSDFKLIGTPWTAPAWAKKGKQLTGNECGTDENELDRGQVDAYAGYFADYATAYDKLGLKPWMISMQNEPQNCKTDMPTTLMNAGDEIALSLAMEKKLPSDVNIMGFDHNWNDPDYVNSLTGEGSVDAVGYHCYDGTHYGSSQQAQALNGKKAIMTECSGFTDQSSDVAGNMGWEVSNLLMGPLRNGYSGSTYWSLAQNTDGSPHLSTDEACQNCRGLLEVEPDGSYTKSQDFYFYAQFAAFIRPGATRIESNNSGDLSTVAFKSGDDTVLVVLNSSSHADGGKPGSSEDDFRGKIVQWDNQGNGQNPSWLVGADGYRRWISDIDTYQCLKDEGGVEDTGTQSGGVLDKYINLKDVWAVCGTSVMGTNSELERNTYLESGKGAKLSLKDDGSLVATDSEGEQRWKAPAKGDRLILQEDGNLVLYKGSKSVWSSGTKGKGAAWLSIRDDGSFILSTKQDETVWTSSIDSSSYKGKIVQWDGDDADQKTSWYVGQDGKRRVIPDWDTFKCLHDAGAGDSKSVSSDTLDKLPDLNGVQATCGADRIGPQGLLGAGSKLTAGDYRLEMQKNGDLVLWKGKSNAVWSTKTNKGKEQYLTIQKDGNMVLYDTSGHSTWSTKTDGHSAGYLVLGDDGSLRLYDDADKQIWSR